MIDIKEDWSSKKKEEAQEENAKSLIAFNDSAEAEKREEYGRSVARSWVQNGDRPRKIKAAPPIKRDRDRRR